MKRWLWIMLAAGLALRLGLVWRPLPELLQVSLTDDAFYYFVIAGNLAAGLGASFDGVNPTNGFHPLWALLLVPIFRFAGGELAVHLALSLGAILDVLAAGVLALLAGRLEVAGRKSALSPIPVPTAPKERPGLTVASLVTAGLYLFNPRLVLESANGLETSLGLVLMALFALALHRAEERWRDWIFAGVLGGLMFLARTDLALVFVFALTAKLWLRARRPITSIREERRGGVLLMLLSAAITVLPWFLWSYYRLGTLLQSSAVALPLLVRYQLGQGNAWAYQWPVIQYGVQMALILPGVTWLVLVGALIWPRLARNLLNRTIPPLPFAVWLSPAFAAVGGAAILAVHVFLRWYPRSWYFLPLAAGLVLLAGVVSPRALTGIGRNWRVGIAAFLVLLVVAQGWRNWGQRHYPGQAETLRAARWLASNTEADAVVGAFNAGVIGYFSERRTVNLDGALDREAISARERGRLLNYLSRQGGGYLVEREAYLWGFFGPFLGLGADSRLIPIKTFDQDSAPYGRLVIYQLD